MPSTKGKPTRAQRAKQNATSLLEELSSNDMTDLHFQIRVRYGQWQIRAETSTFVNGQMYTEESAWMEFEPAIPSQFFERMAFWLRELSLSAALLRARLPIGVREEILDEIDTDLPF